MESIGIYSPSLVRGFDPQVAGNVRIDGLYFDQQGALSDRVVEGSTIRVGVSEIGYAFPAPTGIVDYDLRHPGDGDATATVMAGAGPFESRFVNVDGSLPLVSSLLQLPIGASAQVSASQPGYTSDVKNFGAAPQWTPSSRFSLRAFFDWQSTSDAKTLPLIFTQGPFAPPLVSPGYYGQNWAAGNSLSENFGAIAKANLGEGWFLAAGIFRSIADSPSSYADLYADTQRDGRAEHLLVGYPDQRTASTSGEIRATDVMTDGPWSHEIIILARGRDTGASYGGSDTIDAGGALISQDVQVPRPDFIYSARTDDLATLWSAGLAYRVRWNKHGELTLGLQDENYRDTVTAPGESKSQLSDSPWRAYGDISLDLTDRVATYAGYTQGLEDSGVAPSDALNRGAILPAARTWQYDAGFRYLLGGNVKVVAGIFDVNKPYFNIDTENVDRQLGVQSAKGFEFSIAGELTKNLSVVAGAVLGRVSVTGPDLAAEGVGGTAFGQSRVYYVVDADYSIPRCTALSVDVEMYHFGSAPASVDGSLVMPAYSDYNIGGRYKFKVLRFPTTLRLQVQNAMNVRIWNYNYSPGFFQFAPRTVVAYLTVDL
jgi:iron complex outermembrane receptor protein